MITRFSHITLYVLDQDIAYDFYVNKLGFEVRTDAMMDNGFRWLTVGPKTQPELEVALMLVAAGPIMDEETAATVRSLVQKGALGTGVLDTDDCRKTYEELSAKGVNFKRPPEEQFYGIEALMEDPFGNWFSVTQRTM